MTKIRIIGDALELYRVTVARLIPNLPLSLRDQLVAALVPDPTITPGSARTTDAAEICNGRSTREFRHWSRARDDFIMSEYGLPPGPHPDYEVDHLIALELGGSDDKSNLRPEPRRSIEPTWSAERKDELENKLHELICSGQISVVEAQREIAEDWPAAYLKYINTRLPTDARAPPEPRAAMRSRLSAALERLKQRFGW